MPPFFFTGDEAEAVIDIDDSEFEELPPHETSWQVLDRVTAYRKQLLACGYWPVPCNGKRVHLDDWVNMRATNSIIEAWATTRADHLNTGVLCRDTPFVDIDVTVEEVAEEIEALLEAELENSAVRIGLPPKRAVPFRCDEPFKKLSTQFTSPNGAVQKVEVLGNGQQCVINGTHPETHQPYRWHGGEPGPKLRRENLPLMTAESAAVFIAKAAEIMRGHGWEELNKKTNGAADSNGANNNTRTDDAPIREPAYAQAALEGCADELAATSAGDRNNALYKKSFRMGTMVARGWIGRSDVDAALFDAAAACGLVADDGEAATRKTIGSGIDGGMKVPHENLHDQEPVTAAEPPLEQHPRRTLHEVHGVFRKWFGEGYDTDTIDAVLATAAAERLAGDPLWLLVISGPGNTKTETVQSLSGAGAHVSSTISSEGALLSASPRKSRIKTATGGLLRKIGDRGILVIKDVTSILSADRNTRAGVLAALREVYDGRWERNVGTDGGQTLTWTGRIAVVGAVTTAWDTSHAVVSVMGDRFVSIRSDSTVGRGKAGTRAIRNTGAETAMRAEIVAAVGGLIGHIEVGKTWLLEDDEIDRLVKAADIVTYARTAVERDFRGDVINSHAPEMPTRFAKQLAQMVRGSLALGMGRQAALRLALRCAADSVPQLRIEILLDLAGNPRCRAIDVSRNITKPYRTVRRELEALHMLGLLRCDEEQSLIDETKTVWRYSLAAGFDRETLLTMSALRPLKPVAEK
jgi:Bifunctional DNA primase/polymerase, N-terminal